MRIVLYASVMNSCSELVLVKTLFVVLYGCGETLCMEGNGTQIENRVLRWTFKMRERK
jgi:hypothetical protein